MHKVEINVSGQRFFLFRGPGCLKTMLDCWYHHLDRAEAGEDIRVWGTVGIKTDIVLEWPPRSSPGIVAREAADTRRTHARASTARWSGSRPRR
jgi:hypothetical protein